jgi:hypothetical protein
MQNALKAHDYRSIYIFIIVCHSGILVIMMFLYKISNAKDAWSTTSPVICQYRDSIRVVG